jgi:hypothetical protein
LRTELGYHASFCADIFELLDHELSKPRKGEASHESTITSFAGHQPGWG